MGLYLNIDINTSNTPFLNTLCKNGDYTVEAFWPFIDRYTDSQVTDILLNIFAQYSAAPSKIFTTADEKYLQKTENGIPVDYTDTAKNIYENYTYAHELTLRNIDPFQLWIERCREKGIHPWISVRMNDCHCPDDETCFLRSDFFYQAREKGWMIGKEYGYFRNCLNYAIPEVRQIMLDYIREQLGRYDVYGIELDFMREIYCFDYLNEPQCYRFLNDFMRDIKKTVTAAEKRVNHPIRIGVRVMRDIEQNKIFGLDVSTWVNQGLVDMICVTPRWASNDSDMPIARWKECFPCVEIVAGIETFEIRQGSGASSDGDVVSGLSSAYYSDKADGIYLFNYFIINDDRSKRTKDVINRCGEPLICIASSRRHIMDYQDIAPREEQKYRPLPLPLKAETSLSLLTGEILSDQTTELIIGSNRVLDDSFKVLLNGHPCVFLSETEIYGYDEDTEEVSLNGYCEKNTHLYAFNITNLTEGTRQTVTFFETPDTTVTYMEIRVK